MVTSRDIIAAFHDAAENLPFDPDAVDCFNRKIQIEIERADASMRHHRAVAIELVRIKFRANQKFYRTREAAENGVAN